MWNCSNIFFNNNIHPSFRKFKQKLGLLSSCNLGKISKCYFNNFTFSHKVGRVSLNLTGKSKTRQPTNIWIIEWIVYRWFTNSSTKQKISIWFEEFNKTKLFNKISFTLLTNLDRFFLLPWSRRIRDNGWLGTFIFSHEVCFREIYLIFNRHFTLDFMKYFNFSFENFSKRHKTLFVRVWREKKVSNHSCNSW